VCERELLRLVSDLSFQTDFERFEYEAKEKLISGQLTAVCKSIPYREYCNYSIIIK
jgi:hypothetical protein